MGDMGDLVWNLNPRPLAADKAGKAGKAGTDFKSVPKAGKEKLGQISNLSRGRKLK